MTSAWCKMAVKIVIVLAARAVKVAMVGSSR